MYRFDIRPAVVAATFACTLAFVTGTSARELTVEDRVEAQRAIERVYWSHRLWPADNPTPKPPLIEVMPDAAIRARVADYLAKSDALEAIRRRPITPWQLQAELDRMAADSRDPQLLRELFDALENDPELIAETLVRQRLAGNLVRAEFARIAPRSTNFEAWWGERRSSLRPEIPATRSSYTLPIIPLSASNTSTLPPARFGQTTVSTGSAMILWGGEPLTNTGSFYDPTVDHWNPTSTAAGVPDPRSRHTAVWTGAEMIVWGGLTATGETNTGGIYDLGTDSWTATSTGLNAPTSRQRHAAVWTGTRMLVWGGSAGVTYYGSGASYDPLTDTWSAISAGAGVPAARDQHTAIWSGTQMIVWGGFDGAARLNTGSRYTPGTDTWSAMTTTAAPAARTRHSVVWAGSQMIVWGGFGSSYLNTGGRYNPVLGTWSATAGGPTARADHTAVWNGTDMIIWGGQGAAGALDTGSRYKFSTNTWTAIASGASSPAARYGHSAAWIGNEMFVWGGTTGSVTLDTGGRFTPSSATWEATIGAEPVIRFHPTPQVGTLGARAIFTAIAGGNTPLTYQWRKGGSPLTDGPTISGSTSDTLVVTGLTNLDVADYSVVVSNSVSSATSSDAALTIGLPRGGDIDPAFRTSGMLDAVGNVLIAQSDGKTVVAGFLSAVKGAARGRIARLNADGSLDHTFQNGMTGASATIWSMAQQPDGRVLVGGEFSTFNGANRPGLARLNADGSLDSTFLTGMAGPYGVVQAIVPMPDGKILVGGGFSTVNGDPLPHNGIARLNHDGSVDTTFARGSASGLGQSGTAYAIALQPDGKIVVTGAFTQVAGVDRHGLARLNADGTLDTSFQNGMAGVGHRTWSVALQADGKILIGGEFLTINDVSRPYLARLNVDGSVDSTFLAGMSGPDAELASYAIAVQPDGRIVIGGYFDSVNGVARGSLARLNSDGSVDMSFQADLTGSTGPIPGIAVALRPDGKIAFSGWFEAVNGLERHWLAQVLVDGSVDPNLHPALSGFDNFVSEIELQPDGHAIVGGSFQAIDGNTRNHLARLNPDGSLDASFQNGMAGANADVVAIVRQPDGRVVIGGAFTVVNGVARGRVARLNADGSLDTTFQAGASGADGTVEGIALLPDGRMIIAGTFSHVNGEARTFVARLQADGSLDGTFPDVPVGMAAGEYVPNGVYAVGLDPAGGIMIAGRFAAVAGASRSCVARLHDDGTLDATFQDPVLSLYDPEWIYVDAVAFPPGGGVLIGGYFGSVGGASRSSVARLQADGTLDATFQGGIPGFSGNINRLVVQSDGRVVIGGYFTIHNAGARRGIARLHPDGSVDTSFEDQMAGVQTGGPPNHSGLRSIAQLPDGRLLIGGSMGSINDRDAKGIARLYGSAPVAPAIATPLADQLAYAGSCAVVHVEATGTPLDYRWRKSTVDLVDGGNVSGVAVSTLTLTNLTNEDAGSYDVVVTNVLGDSTSAAATLTVANVPECKIATCDPLLGSVLADAPDGSACNDGNVCTVGDACAGGACTPGTPVPPPAEVASLALDGHGPTTLSWAAAGGGALYDVASSTLADLRAGGTIGATCAANDLAVASYVDGQPTPTPGAGYYYLTRAQTTCGDGTYGSNSAGVPRAPVAACP